MLECLCKASYYVDNAQEGLPITTKSGWKKNIVKVKNVGGRGTADGKRLQ